MADENTPAFYPRVGNITPRPRAPLAQAEVREQPLDPIMRTFKDLMDRSSALLDKSKVSPFDVTKGLISAIPFEGERFAKDFEKSTMPIPTGFGLLPKATPQGIDTSEMGMQSVRVPTKEALDQMKWSDLVGTAGASRMFEALGQNRTPEFFDTLDATMLGLGGLSAARAAPKVAKAVGEGAKTVGMGGLEMVNRGMFGEGPLRNFVPQHKMVVKPPNGNWFGTSLPESMAQFKRNTVAGNEPAEILREMRERYTPEVIEGLQEGSRNHVNDSFALLEKDVALNNWVERNLTNYVKKQMATPEDPVRKLAEEGIVHIPTSEVGVNRYRAPEHRNRYGGEQLGQSEAARAWEDASDVAINAPKVSEISSPGFISRNPYVEKLPPDERIYGLNSPASYSQEIKGLGFDHIIDVLREDITSGRIRPEQLNKVSMEQAVRRTYEYDQELARKMNEARATSRAELPVHKDYPEGFKWVQLNRPGDFSSESDAMGHSVRGYEPPKGHPDWAEGSGDMGNLGYGHGGWDAIKSGKAKVYSLIDSKGQPHTTVEIKAHNTASPNDFKNAGLNYSEAMEEAKRRMGITPENQKVWVQNSNSEQRAQASKDLYKYIDEIYKERTGDMPMSITQIKGKQNRAPNEEYLPYVQDFVKGGKWTDVGDFQNTNLRRIEDIPERARFESAGMKLPNYLTDAEHENLINEYMKLTSHPTDLDFMHKAYGFPKPDAPPAPEGMKRGGKVSISNNPDTMMLEVNNQKFGMGGLAKVTKAAKNIAEPMKASEALGKIEGRPLKITQSDRTKVGGGYLGGPGFSSLQLTEPEYRAAEAAWGVQNAGTAKTILGGGKKGDNAVYAAMIGTPTQHQSNQMVFDKLYGDFRKAAKRGELTPELRDLINTRLAASIDKKGNPVFPADVDILDKNFRDIADTFSRRSIAGHLMGGVQVGGKKGQIIDYDKIIRNTTDPALLDLPTGSLGNRLFTLSGGIVDRPDLHPAFPAILQGEDLGVTFTPVERNLVMKDFVDKTMREKGRKPGYMDYTRGNPPTQLITEDILTELQKLGLKKGGAVHKAEGGEVSGDDLILEERPL
jgi:hypothetical protein